MERRFQAIPPVRCHLRFPGTGQLRFGSPQSSKERNLYEKRKRNFGYLETDMNGDAPGVKMKEIAQLNRIDAFLPAEMAERAGLVGVKKVNLPIGTMFLLAVLVGAFIALGAVFAITVTAGAASQLPFGVVRLLGGVASRLGLILVVVAGAWQRVGVSR